MSRATTSYAHGILGFTKRAVVIGFLLLSFATSAEAFIRGSTILGEYSTGAPILDQNDWKCTWARADWMRLPRMDKQHNLSSRLPPLRMVATTTGSWARQRQRGTAEYVRPPLPPPPASTLDATRTLYDVLQADPSSTRSELKKQYVALAKLSHPDAVIAQGAGAGLSDTNNRIDFTEVAAAYRILSDPLQRKRYDRSLLAESFKRDVERVASDIVTVAGPRVAHLFEHVALPLLKRTVTAASSAIVGGLELKKEGAMVEKERTKCDEPNSKSPMEEAAVPTAAETSSSQLRREDLVTEHRLLLTLRTLDSPLSSDESNKILSRLNKASPEALSRFNRVVAKRMLRDHISFAGEMELDDDLHVEGVSSNESSSLNMATVLAESELRRTKERKEYLQSERERLKGKVLKLKSRAKELKVIALKLQKLEEQKVTP